MDISFADLKEKEIINVFDGKKLGRIVDILFDGSSGVVRGIVVPGERKLFRKNEDVFVSLERIRKIGDDVILVSLPVQNQVSLTGQFANFYDRSGRMVQEGTYNGMVAKNSNGYVSQSRKYVSTTGVNNEALKTQKTNTQGVRYFDGSGVAQNSFVRYKRIDNKKYK